MDQQTARRLVLEGGTLIINDMPKGSEFGIDLNTYKTGPKFRGVKMIPTGLHFIYFSSVNKEGGTAPRTGFFHSFKSAEILVKKWNYQTEDLIDVTDNDDYRSMLLKPELDRCLGAYQFDTYDKWIGLSDYITDSLLSQLNPKNGQITSVSHLIPLSSKFSNIPMEKDGTPCMLPEPNAAINFSEIPKLCPDDCSASEISKHNIDSSFALTRMIQFNNESFSVLGELQFAFIVFLVGQSYDGFEQWKLIFRLIATSDEALTNNPNFFLNFIRVLYFQLQEVPSDFFVDIVDGNNFLLQHLRTFFLNLQNEKIDEKLRRRALRFRENLVKRFNWDFSIEPEDEAPVVVQI